MTGTARRASALFGLALAVLGLTAAHGGLVAGPTASARAALTTQSMPQNGNTGLPPEGDGRLPGPGGPPRVPRIGQFAELEGSYCPSRSVCFAVGAYQPGGTTAELNQVLRWDGRRWQQVRVPDPGGTAPGSVSELFGIRCPGQRDCWAVGQYATGGAYLNQILHWNGRAWSLVRAPDPGGTGGQSVNELIDVTCTSSDRCWAVGQFGTGSGPTGVRRNQVLRWTGTHWFHMTSPDPLGSGQGTFHQLSAVRCATAGSCFAVGTAGYATGPPTEVNEALHWNGRRWSQVTTPDPGGTALGALNILDGLTCASPTSCWAAGTYGSNAAGGMALNQMLHWNGHGWFVRKVPDPDGTGAGADNALTAAYCISPASCWAVGFYGSISPGLGSVRNEILRWDGTRWSSRPSPDPAGTGDGDYQQLWGVRCTGASSCWAVGLSERGSDPVRDEALHWNGRTWSAR